MPPRLRWYEKRINPRNGIVTYMLRREVGLGNVLVHGLCFARRLPRQAVAYGLWRARLKFRQECRQAFLDRVKPLAYRP